ncbi:hypothetical protein VNI00_005668 [Paramarasmius palmivorus]|uniref:Uncharacterized protein n=1 Tax=Paramarasmius palmivorus TaxID=297713 RepID=A0AAW0DH78_9AGAR
MSLPTDPQKLQPSLPEGWNLCVHPRGWIYFHNPTLKLLTDQDIYDPELRSQLLGHAASLKSSEWEEGMELMLHVNLSGDIDFILAINHNHCVASQSPSNITGEAVQNLGHNLYQLNRYRRLYWNHLCTHPNHVPCPPRAVSDASDALIWFYTDSMLSGARSDVPFNKTECDELMKLVKEMELPCNTHSAAKTLFLSWLLREVCSFRNSQNYGCYTKKEADFRASNRSGFVPALYDRTPSSIFLPLLHVIINVLFFGLPWTYLAHVKSSFQYHGRFVGLQVRWKQYIERLVREYSHFLLVTDSGQKVNRSSFGYYGNARRAGNLYLLKSGCNDIFLSIFGERHSRRLFYVETPGQYAAN